MIRYGREDKSMPDTIEEVGRKRQGFFREMDEPGYFRAGSITPTTGQKPDKPSSE
jgi:hypothetical protein